MEFEAPDYSEEGVNTFKNSAIYNEAYLEGLVMFGAYADDNIVGVIATRNAGSHIALFFVDGKYQRQGIGGRLFQKVLAESTSDEITVNSSPYAVEIYRRLGFAETDDEQIADGIRFTPMRYSK